MQHLWSRKRVTSAGGVRVLLLCFLWRHHVPLLLLCGWQCRRHVRGCARDGGHTGGRRGIIGTAWVHIAVDERGVVTVLVTALFEGLNWGDVHDLVRTVLDGALSS